MEQEAPEPDDQVAEKSHQEDIVMAASKTIGNPLVGQIDENQIRQGIHDLGGVDCGIVVLKRAPVRMAAGDIKGKDPRVVREEENTHGGSLPLRTSSALT
jgi:hypothetical protein